MEYIKHKYYESAIGKIKKIKEIKETKGDKVVGQVTINQVLTGMKGVPSLLTETSKLDPNEGIRFRGYSISQLREKLPKKNNEPLPEGLFYLMLIGELPDADDVNNISTEWSTKAYVPQHVFDVIDALPKTARPMTQFITAIMSLAPESGFQKSYRAGIHKKFYWDSTYDDAISLIARLPRIAAYIYRRNYHNDDHIEPNPKLDWAGNLAHMMGHDTEEVRELLRLYMTIHADHEGGNVSAHATHLVGSALSNACYAFGAGMAGLAGPLHGYANQQVISWIIEMTEELNTKTPSKQQVEDFVKNTLDSGRVIPGYGHAVLRVTDPRYTAQKAFADKFIKNDPIVDIVNTLYDVVPPILEKTGKISNPWPNVDAYSGALLNHYGIKEHNFYTVLFGVSRALGVLTSLINDRMFGLPIERPSSYTLDWFENI
ncbi:MAG: citrate (Si)-synthase [Bacteroidales bacterium]